MHSNVRYGAERSNGILGTGGSISDLLGAGYFHALAQFVILPTLPTPTDSREFQESA